MTRHPGQGQPRRGGGSANTGPGRHRHFPGLQGGPTPTSPADAIAQQEANQGRTHTIPVYESDGTTVIGEFTIG